MQLVSNGMPKERPSNFDLAKRLMRPNLRENNGRYELWTDGQWVHADVDAIMIRANRLLKGLGKPQFKGKELWVQ